MRRIKISKNPSKCCPYYTLEGFHLVPICHRNGLHCLMALYTGIPSLMKHHVITLQTLNWNGMAYQRMPKSWKTLFFALFWGCISIAISNILRAARMSWGNDLMCMVMVAAKPIIYWAQGSHGCSDCGRRLSQTFSVCSQAGRLLILTGCFMAARPNHHWKGTHA